MGGKAARASVLFSAVVTALLLAPAGHALGSADIAALQVALRDKGMYAGDVDGVVGPATQRAVRTFQKRKKLAVDGVVGRQTRAALGRFARHDLGSRLLRSGLVGWDVAELQFLLAWHGFPSGEFDGRFGPRLEGAVGGFQRWAGLGADGRAGPATLAALRGPRPRVALA